MNQLVWFHHKTMPPEITKVDQIQAKLTELRSLFTNPNTLSAILLISLMMLQQLETLQDILMPPQQVVYAPSLTVILKEPQQIPQMPINILEKASSKHQRQDIVNVSTRLHNKARCHKLLMQVLDPMPVYSKPAQVAGTDSWLTGALGHWDIHHSYQSEPLTISEVTFIIYRPHYHCTKHHIGDKDMPPQCINTTPPHIQHTPQRSASPADHAIDNTQITSQHSQAKPPSCSKQHDHPHRNQPAGPYPPVKPLNTTQSQLHNKLLLKLC